MDTPTPLPPAPGGMFQGASPKLTFVFGLIAGVAFSGLVGLALILPGFVGKSKTANTAVADTTTTNTNTAPAAPTYSAPKAVSSADYARGNKKAKVVLVEFSDYECPFCKTFHPTMANQVMKDYGDKILWVYRQFPLSFHQNAQKEAEAGLCVGKLGGTDKFWAFSDKIFERTTSNGTGFSLDALGPLAKEVGVNQSKFQSCLDSGEMTAAVQAEEADGGAAGVSGTPTTLVLDSNGKFLSAIPGAYPYDQVKQTIDAALAQAS